ncbi:MAG TPA: 50S ribosomal protein L3 [Pseudogracilibacillus sp.]|nr:50S ribosomal protein L3 [Pseudogracilibacillus sp.]
MTKGILGRKVGMTQIFSETGELIPVTVVEAEPNVVLQKRTNEVDGYEALQLGFADEKDSRTNKAEAGHAKKANANPKRYVREFRNINIDDHEVGGEVGVNVFEAGDIIDVAGTSKGKGYAGTVKRYNYATGPNTHGSHFHRTGGSMGNMDSKRVFKGKQLPGQMGAEHVTIQNLQVVKVDEERNALLIKGNIPGAKKSLVKVTTAIKGN